MPTATTVPVKMAQRRDTAANWTSINPTLLAGEIGLESDTGYWKVGDGSTAWNSLAYITGLGGEIPVSRLADGSARQLLQTAANGTDVEWTSNVDVPGTLDVTGAATFDSNVTIQGDLTVNGTTTTIDTTNLAIEDKNIEIGKVTTPTDVTADGGGITLKGTTDKTINWVDATDAWTFSEHVNIASAKEYRIAGTKVLDATSLGSGVVSSSLTSVGTIGTGIWNGTTIGTGYGGTGQTTYTDGQLLIGKTDGTLAKATLTAGSNVTITNGNGSITIASAAVPDGDKGDITVSGSGGTWTIDSGAVTSAKIADGTIVDGDINASAAIAGTKISPDFGSQNVTTTGTVTGASLIPSSSTAPTNGVYLPAANTVGISTGGSGRLFVDSSGRVGVGTSSPNAILDLTATAGAGGQTSVIRFGLGATAESWIGVANSAGNIITNSTQGDTVIRNDGGKILLSTDSGTTAHAVIDSSGRFGIGTSSPQQKLAVVSSGVGYEIDQSSIANTNLLLSYDRAASAYRAVANYYGGTYSWNDGGTERMRIDSSGRLGIGTNPSHTLDVAGTIRNTGALLTALTNGNLTARELGGSSANNAIEFHIRPNSGKSGYLTFTEDSIDDRWSIGIQNGNGGLRFISGTPTSGTERVRLTASGQWLVGTSSSPSSGNGQYSPLVIQGYIGGSTGEGGISIQRGQAASSIVADTAIGVINFNDNAGNTFANIIARGDATAGTNDYPGRLVFSTTASGSSSPTERFRINNAGSFSAVIPSGSTLYPAFWCRAWVNFNGTSTVSIRANGNVSSITDNGTGDYTVNFTTAMPDASYCSQFSGDTTQQNFISSTTSSVRLYTSNSSGTLTDDANVSVAIFR